VAQAIVAEELSLAGEPILAHPAGDGALNVRFSGLDDRPS